MKKSIGKVFMAMGLLLVLAAAGLLAYNTRESSRAGKASSRILTQLTEEMPQAETPQTETRSEETEPAVLREMTVKTVDGLDYIGYLSIPELELELPVQAEWEMEALRRTPCRYAGTLSGDDLIIAAHNYRQHFALLHTLRAGDAVLFTDAAGLCHRYTVSLVEILDETAVEEMTAGEWDLTLFTCNYDGRARITVRCIREL